MDAAGRERRAAASGPLGRGAGTLRERRRDPAARPGSRQVARGYRPSGIVRGAELADLQPGLSPALRRGNLHPEMADGLRPLRLRRRDGGGRAGAGRDFRRAEVRVVRPLGDGVRIDFTDGTVLTAGTAVVAAGAWSRPLTAPLGDHIPLETERGYNTTLPARRFDLKRAAHLLGHGFVVTPLSTGLRVGGAVELGGLEAAAEFCARRGDAGEGARIPARAQTKRRPQWMGFRPSLPDSPAGHRPLATVAAHRLCFRPRPSWPDAVGRDRQA